MLFCTLLFVSLFSLSSNLLFFSFSTVAMSAVNLTAEDCPYYDDRVDALVASAGFWIDGVAKTGKVLFANGLSRRETPLGRTTTEGKIRLNGTGNCTDIIRSDLC